MANDATITGSIGVIGLSLNTSKFWKQFGINREVVVKEGEHAFYRLISELSEVVNHIKN